MHFEWLTARLGSRRVITFLWALTFVVGSVSCGPMPPPTPRPMLTPSLTATPVTPATVPPPTRILELTPNATRTPALTVVPTPTAVGERPAIPLAAMFLSWYGFDVATGDCVGGLGSLHWNNHPNTGGVVYEPEKGYYCSADPDVVAWQLRLLDEIGVKVLIVSWWGWGDGDLDGEVEGNPDMFINRGVEALLDGIIASKHDIKVALIVEPFTLTQAQIDPDALTAEQKQMVLDWLWSNYYGEYPELMYSWQGKPLLIAFDPMRLSPDPRYTVRLWTGRARDEQTESEGWQWFFAPPQDPIAGMSDDGVAFVYPRFDEYPAKRMGADYIWWEARRVNPFWPG